MLLFINLLLPTAPLGSLRIRFVATTGRSLACRVERLRDGWLYDFATSGLIFTTSPTQPFGVIPEVTSGLYATKIWPTPSSIFTDGNYSVTLHDSALNYQAIGIASATMASGDDEPLPTTTTTTTTSS